MNTKDKAVELKFIIERFDHYYDSVNNKGNLYVGVNTFFFGGALVGYNSLDQMRHFGPWSIIVFLIPFLLCNILSFSNTLWAIKPFTQKHSTANSLLFFADVSQMTQAQWNEKWAVTTDESWKEDLQTQTYLLAGGLQRKFEYLQCATIFLAVQVALFFCFSVFYYITYKI